VHPPLRITVPDQSLAETLRRRLREFEVEAQPVDGHVQLEIALRDRNPERRISDVLHTVDTWLVSSGVGSVQIHLDGNSYTLHAPVATERASA
jgi:hypothetical protein